MDEADSDRVFFALSDRTRRAMLDVLRSEPGGTVGALCERFPMSRIAAMKHLKVLERAHLVTSKRDGRARLLYLNIMPLQRIYDRWTTEWTAHWAHGLARLKDELEARPTAGRRRTHPPRRRP